MAPAVLKRLHPRPGGHIIGVPLDIAVPQYARWRGKAGVQRAILIQAERAGSTAAVGLKIIATGARVAATLPEVELLGTDPPQAAP